MGDFLKKSISNKFVVFLFIFLIVLSAAGFLVPQEKFRLAFIILLIIFAVSVFSLYFLSIKKPLNKVLDEMKALLTGRKYNKIYTPRLDEIGLLAHFFNTVTKNIEKISVQVAEGKRMSSELEIASNIQKSILPKELPQTKGLDVFANTRAAVEIGGDNYDVIPFRDNSFIYLGDVTGHGVPAGLGMMMANILLRTFCEFYRSGYDIVVQTNRILKLRLPSTMFMTMVMLRWNETEKKMYITGAGHEHVIVYHATTSTAEVKQSGGIALGMLPDSSRITKEELLLTSEGDFIILYSDGIIDEKNVNGEQFGLKRLKETVEKHAPLSRSARELFTYITTEFAKFVEDQKQIDDVSLMVLKRQ